AGDAAAAALWLAAARAAVAADAAVRAAIAADAAVRPTGPVIAADATAGAVRFATIRAAGTRATARAAAATGGRADLPALRHAAPLRHAIPALVLSARTAVHVSVDAWLGRDPTGTVDGPVVLGHAACRFR